MPNQAEEDGEQPDAGEHPTHHRATGLAERSGRPPPELRRVDQVLGNGLRAPAVANGVSPRAVPRRLDAVYLAFDAPLRRPLPGLAPVIPPGCLAAAMMSELWSTHAH